jgi:hypothetical protein
MTDTLDAGARSPSTSTDPGAEPELVLFLERDQLTSDTAVPLRRAYLTRRLSIALWVLRVFVIAVSAMVVYTFAVSLH